MGNPNQEGEKTHIHNNVDPTKEKHTDWNLNTWTNQENTGEQNV